MRALYYCSTELTCLQAPHKGIRRGALDDIAALFALEEGEALKQDEAAILPWLSTDPEAVATPRPGAVKTVTGNTSVRAAGGTERAYAANAPVSTKLQRCSPGLTDLL